MIRVALASPATPRASAGMHAYARALIERMAKAAPDVDLVAVGAPPALQPWALRSARAQLVHLAYPDLVPPVPRPYVAMLHDLIHLRYPAQFSRATAAYWRFVGAPLYRGAARVLVSDPRVADDGVALLRIARERVRVVPLGYGDAIPAAEPWPAQRPYLFYAGNHRPHKSLPTMYAAWAALPPQLALDLVLTGPDEPAVRGRYLRERGAIEFLGDVDEATLARRYRGALAYVQPSSAEGFGIPVLEAAVAGTPVLASTAAVPGVARPFVQTFTPGDVGALGALIEAVAREPAAARARAAEGAVTLRAYTWDRFAASTAAVYREVVCP